MFIKYSNLLTRVGRDDYVDDSTKLVCLLHGIEEKYVYARQSIFVEVKCDLEILPLHI